METVLALLLLADSDADADRDTEELLDLPVRATA